MQKDIYFSLEKTAYTNNVRVTLLDFCKVIGADTEPLKCIHFHISGEALCVTAFDVAQRIMAIYPQASVNSLGAAECSIFIKHKKQSKALTALKLLFLCAVMFFGGAIAIMTFHEDVGMRSVQNSIYTFFTGIRSGNALIVSIPYTIGIAIGFIVLFGLLDGKKKKPSVLDIDIHEQEKALRDYIATKSKMHNG